MNYSDISADPVIGPRIGQLYLDASPEITPLARRAYDDMAVQVAAQFVRLTESVRVVFQDEDPYADWSAMVYDVSVHGRLRVYATPEDQRHPVLGRHGNDMLRAVHDFYGHFGDGNGEPVSFTRHGEEAAWVRHSSMFTGLGRRAMTTETRGQNSAFIWINGGREFPEQKAVLLPEWVDRVPERWRTRP